MTSLVESQAFLDQFDRCLPLCERGDAVTVINALHTLNSITQASIAQAVELREGKDFVCSFLLELELALELYISPSRKLGTIDGGLPSLYSFTDEEVSALGNTTSPCTKAKVAKFLEALGVAPSPEFQTRSVADTVVDFLRCQVKPAHAKPAQKHAPSKRNISWADQCSSGSDSDSDCSLPPLEDEDDIDSGRSVPSSVCESEERTTSHDSSQDYEFEEFGDGFEAVEEEQEEEEEDLVDAAACLFLAPAPVHPVESDIFYESSRPSTRGCGGSSGPARFSGKNQDPFYKTRMCKNFKSGTCAFGDQCNFAHGENELRSADVAMQAFASSAVCPTAMGQKGPEKRGDTAAILHKTRMCSNYQRDGVCKFGDRCAFAHGMHELRKRDSSKAQN